MTLPSTMEVTVVLTPRGGSGALHGTVETLRGTRVGERQHLSYATLESAHGADPRHIEALRAHAASHGLTVSDVNAVGPSVKLRGDADAMGSAFGVHLVERRNTINGAAATYLDHDEEPSLPDALSGAAVAILGLRTRPLARPKFVVAGPAAAGQGNTALDVARAYGLPAGAAASGSVIGIVELGGGYTDSDVTAYAAALRIAVPQVTAVSVDGVSNSPSGSVSSPDGEVALDIDVIAAVAAGAAIRVYFAPNTEQGFVDAIATAARDGCVAVSISWGAPEADWSSSGMQALDQACQGALALGTPVFAASGDRGSADGISDGRSHADFPASSPHAVGCGGTALPALTVAQETSWNDLASGGGAGGGAVSDVWPLPAFQQQANPPPSVNDGKVRRTVPDLAADAAPETGYRVLVGGSWYILGGTSAVAPLICAMHAVLDSAVAAAHPGQRIGDFTSVLYGTLAPGGGVHDIADGSGNGQYVTRPGYDAVTGWGSPEFGRWMSLLTGD
ncbi:MAG: S8 family serine peptidase [Candidatus Dormibacteraeota bacterium]|nr:S8 family serine peptidase [Candidatus Dormibacteraeota bacterium]